MFLEPDVAKLREWKDKSGKFSVEAAYLGISDNKVQLHKTNGVIIGVPLDKLDDGTLDYLKTLPGNESLDIGSKPNIPVPPPGGGGPRRPSGIPVAADTGNFSYNGFNWKDWLMNAGIASSDAAEYAKKFVDQRLDSSILSEVDREALRAMGITEGDIIRIRKAANLPSMNTATRAKANQIEASAHARNLELINSKANSKIKESQIAADEALARRIQEEEMRVAGAASPVSSNVVNSAALFESGNLLAASSTMANAKSDSRNSSISFAKPPSTQEVTSAHSLGLNASARPRASTMQNDPWQGNASSSSNPAQEALLRAQQEETQKTLETARLAIQKANEQARQAALLEEQAKVAKMNQQSQLALLQAQETAKQAMLIQQQAAQKLMSAQMEANYIPTAQPGSFGYAPMQSQPRPLTAPLIPTPASGGLSNNFIPTGPAGPVRQNIPMQAPMQATNVTPNGVQKPSWNNASMLFF